MEAGHDALRQIGYRARPARPDLLPDLSHVRAVDSGPGDEGRVLVSVASSNCRLKGRRSWVSECRFHSLFLFPLLTDAVALTQAEANC